MNEAGSSGGEASAAEVYAAIESGAKLHLEAIRAAALDAHERLGAGLVHRRIEATPPAAPAFVAQVDFNA